LSFRIVLILSYIKLLDRPSHLQTNRDNDFDSSGSSFYSACLTVLYLPHVNSPISAALNVFGIFWSTLITSILVYRASPWHPLAKYPGPLICKLTEFYLAFLSLRGKKHLYYSQLHKKYGVRIGAYKNYFYLFCC
jgi:hypothetical protein